MLGGRVINYEKDTNYCIKVLESVTTFCYLVKKHYFEKLLLNFQESLEQNQPLDVYWLILQYADKWYELCPIVCTQWANKSDILGTFTDYTSNGYMTKLPY